MAPPPSSERHNDLPDHLLHQKILPRLPFKYLSRLKCVSKELHSLISTDAKFAVDQSCSADTSSSSFVYMSDGILSFFPDQALIGVPDPSLKFLKPTTLYRVLNLISCTNGLLLLEGKCSRKLSLCVCNPATKEMVSIPEIDGWEKYSICEMGLAYDPRELPDQFTIVQPPIYSRRDGCLYQFIIFRSDTGKWTHSSQSINLGSFWVAFKAVYAKGVIYWCCLEYLLWYDTKRDLAGTIVLPAKEKRIHVGVYSGEITFCNAWVGGIEVWRLTGGSRWDRLHATSWDGMLDAFNLCHSQSEMFFSRHSIIPIEFDGQFVYIVVRLRNRYSTPKLFRWETETGRTEDKGPMNLRQTSATNLQKKNLRQTWYPTKVFKYANSMARVPQILKGTF